MNNASVSGRLLATLFLLSSLCTRSVFAEDTLEADPLAETSSAEERAYRRAIQEMESSNGAYAEELPESLHSLALTLQSQGRHDQAIRAFKRGRHLTRINEGLYCEQQIPLLLGEIASHKATGNYTRADERQRYLYRVQVRTMQSGDTLADAMMQQAHWQYEAYQLGLEGSEGYTRLVDMSDLYRMAVRDVIEREGEKSPKLLAPLRGMLQAEYLISDHEFREPDQVLGEEPRISESLRRFKLYRTRSFKQGNSIIGAISDIERERSPADVTALARTRLMLGDWLLWNGRTEDAWEAYQEAEAELARIESAQPPTERLLGEPVALPDMVELRSLPPEVEPQQGNVQVAFTVNEYGRVHDLERLDDNDELDGSASRLIRKLRRTTFRPRFEAGQPVETENFVKAFELQ